MRQRIAKLLRQFPWIMTLLYLIFRLFQRKYTIGVVGVIFNDAGEILIVEHVLHPKHPWGLPGGWLEHREQPAETIVREVYEELALTIQAGPTLLIELTNRNHLDIALLCDAHGNVGEMSHELLAYRWIKPDQLPRIRFFHQRAIQEALKIKENNGNNL